MKTDTQQPAEAATKAAEKPAAIVLDMPLQRGTTQITEVTLRKPNAGELRGINLADLLQLNATALVTVLPRITMPTLTPPECAQLDPADLIELGTKVAGFFIRKSIRAEFQNA